MGLSVNPKPQTTLEAWGTRISSDPGEVSTLVEKRKALANVIFNLVPLIYVPKPILLSVSGLLVHPFMNNRVLMACLHRTYKCSAGFRDLDIVFPPNDIKNELASAGLLLPNAYINIRAPIGSWVSTTDAAATRGASTTAIVSNELVSTLYRAAPTRGSLVRFDHNIFHHDPVCVEADEVIQDLVASIPWRVVRNHELSQTSHINLQDKREASSELRSRVELIERSSQQIYQFCGLFGSHRLFPAWQVLFNPTQWSDA